MWTCFEKNWEDKVQKLLKSTEQDMKDTRTYEYLKNKLPIGREKFLKEVEFYYQKTFKAKIPHYIAEVELNSNFKMAEFMMKKRNEIWESKLKKYFWSELWENLVFCLFFFFFEILISDHLI